MIQGFPGSSTGKESESRSVVSDSATPWTIYSPWNSPGQNTGVGSICLQELCKDKGNVYKTSAQCLYIISASQVAKEKKIRLSTKRYSGNRDPDEGL